MSNPKISVIVSAFNAESSINESIQSILNQTFIDFELLIADDSSTDSTKLIIDSFSDKRIRRFHNEKNLHVCSTWNKLLNEAKGDYITFHDADDISYPQWLQKLYEYALLNPEFAIIGANHLRPFQGWGWFNISNFKTSNIEITNSLEKYGIVESFGPRSLFKAEIIKLNKGFRSLFNNCGWEDYDLFLRILEKHPVTNIPDVLYEYRYNPKSYSRIDFENLDFKKAYIHEIGLFLHRQRLENNGIDALMVGGRKDEFQSFLITLERKFLENKTFTILKIVNNKRANLDFLGAYRLLLQLLKNSPFNSSLLKSFFATTFYLGKAIIKKVLVDLKFIKIENRHNCMHL